MSDEYNFEPQTETEPIKGGGGGLGGPRPPRRTRVGTGGDDDEELRNRVLKIYQMLQMANGQAPSAREVAQKAQLSQKKVESLIDSMLKQGGPAAAVLSAKIDYLAQAVQDGLITMSESVLVFREAQERGETIRSVLKRWGVNDVLLEKSTLELRYGVDFVVLKNAEIEMSCLDELPEAFVLTKAAVAINWNGKCLTVAMVKPDDVEAVDQLTHTYLRGKRFTRVVCSEKGFHDFIKEIYCPHKEGKLKDSARVEVVTVAEEVPSIEVKLSSCEIADSRSLKSPSSTFFEEYETESDYLEQACSPSIVKVVNRILRKAIESGVSDIHIEPQVNDVLVRYRHNGVLRLDRMLPKRMCVPLACRLKQMALLDPEDRFSIQEGLIKVKATGEEIDIDVSVVPAKHGERIVLRIRQSGTGE